MPRNMYFLLAPLLCVTACAHAPSLPSTETPIAENAQDTGVMTVFSPATQRAFIECGIDQPELERLLSLKYRDFDQDMMGGWRAISKQDQCKNTAGEVIKAYILYSHPYPPESLKILRWHAGQLKATAQKTNEAIALFKGSYDAEDDQMEWNLYVDATIAFLNNDRAALEIAQKTLAARSVPEGKKAGRRQFLKDHPEINMPDGFVDEPQNLTPVNRLLRCFGQPYGQAYGSCEE